MKITFLQLKNAQPALTKLLNQDLDVRVSLPLRRVVKAVDAELEHFDAERMKLIEKFAQKDEAGKILTKDDQAVFGDEGVYVQFRTEFEKLADVEIEMDVKPIDLSKVEGVKMSPVELNTIDPFLVADEQ
jgi:hypothetical protein